MLIDKKTTRFLQH